MKIALIVLGALAVLLLVVVLVGYSLPVKHTASSSATYATTPDSLFTTISALEGRTAWRKGLKSVEAIPSTDGKTRFREISSDGTIAYVVERSEPNRTLVTRIDDKSLPFGGTWTYELTPAGNGTTLTIREDGEVYNPIFRFVSRFVMGHDGTIKKYLSDLGTKFPRA